MGGDSRPEEPTLLGPLTSGFLGLQAACPCQPLWVLENSKGSQLCISAVARSVCGTVRAGVDVYLPVRAPECVHGNTGDCMGKTTLRWVLCGTLKEGTACVFGPPPSQGYSRTWGRNPPYWPQIPEP